MIEALIGFAVYSLVLMVLSLVKEKYHGVMFSYFSFCGWAGGIFGYYCKHNIIEITNDMGKGMLFGFAIMLICFLWGMTGGD